MSNENFKLNREIDAAKLLRTSLADILADDPEFAADVVLGETNLNEAIQTATALYCQDKVAVDAIKAHVAVMQARADRLKRRMEMTRTLVATALDVAGRKKVETPLGNAALRPTQPRLIIDPDKEASIPLDYWKRGDPILDKEKLKTAVGSGEKVDGVRLSEAGISVTFTFR